MSIGVESSLVLGGTVVKFFLYENNFHERN